MDLFVKKGVRVRRRLVEDARIDRDVPEFVRDAQNDRPGRSPWRRAEGGTSDRWLIEELPRAAGGRRKGARWSLVDLWLRPEEARLPPSSRCEAPRSRRSCPPR